jgi:hypothetical protein
VLEAQPDNRNIASMLIVQILFLHMAKNLRPHPADRPDVGEAVNDKLQIFMVPPATYSVDAVSAARRSWGPSGGLPWLLGGSEDPWLSVPVFQRVWLCHRRKLNRREETILPKRAVRLHLEKNYANKLCPLWVVSGPFDQY